MPPSAHPLDNPVWTALATGQIRFRQGDAQACRYPADVAPFAAVAANTAPAWQALRRLLPSGQQAALLSAAPLAPIDGLQIRPVGVIHQMVAARLDAPPAPDADMAELGPADATDMVSLARQTKPGPFSSRTHEMGRYIGIRHEGRLIAMAGERMRPAGHVEISAVCVDEGWRGQGIAGRLIRRLQHDIQARGDTPFLHVLSSNLNAIALYERLGFEQRRTFSLALAERA